MGPRITIIGGGSYQWTPKLLVDFVNTPALQRRATWSCTTSIPPRFHAWSISHTISPTSAASR